MSASYTATQKINNNLTNIAKLHTRATQNNTSPSGARYKSGDSKVSPYAHDILDRNRRQKPVPVFDASDMEFSTECFRYQFPVTNSTCCIFVLVYGTSFLVRKSGKVVSKVSKVNVDLYSA